MPLFLFALAWSLVRRGVNTVAKTLSDFGPCRANCYDTSGTDTRTCSTRGAIQRSTLTTQTHKTY